MNNLNSAMPQTIHGEDTFRVFANKFALSKTSAILKMSIDGINFEECTEQPDGSKEVSIITECVSGMIYKLEGNTDDVLLLY